MYLSIAQPFDLKLSLTMGQAFRWRPLGDGWFSGVLGEYLVHIRQTDGGVEYRAGSADGDVDADLSELLCRYFRLDTDNIGAIYDELCGDRQVATMIWRYRGLRLLRQEPWECLVSYICSANNNIPNINAIVEKIAETFGQAVQLNGDRRHTFPPRGTAACRRRCGGGNAGRNEPGTTACAEYNSRRPAGCFRGIGARRNGRAGIRLRPGG